MQCNGIINQVLLIIPSLSLSTYSFIKLCICIAAQGVYFACVYSNICPSSEMSWWYFYYVRLITVIYYTCCCTPISTYFSLLWSLHSLLLLLLLLNKSAGACLWLFPFVGYWFNDYTSVLFKSEDGWLESPIPVICFLSSVPWIFCICVTFY